MTSNEDEREPQPVKATPVQATPVRAVGNEIHETRAAGGRAQEFRSLVGAGEIRAVAGSDNQFVARVCNYGVVDTYGTSWAPGVFADSLRSKLPKAVWSHDWNRPIGKVVSFEDGQDGLDVTVQLAGDYAPDARMAHGFLKDGIIDNFSFGFVRQADKPDPANPGATLITKAEMDEVSPVLVGSVPGTRTISVRSDAPVEARAAADILTRFGAGEIDLADALTTLKTASARAVVTEASVGMKPTASGDKAPNFTKGAGKSSMKRTPHSYVKTNGDGSVCKTCGGQSDAKAHTKRMASASEIRALSIDIASDTLDVGQDDTPENLVAACDAAVDAAIALASYQDLTQLPWWVAQMLALVMAADASIDAAMVMMGVPDPDEQTSDGMVRAIQDDHEVREPDKAVTSLTDRLGRLAR